MSEEFENDVKEFGIILLGVFIVTTILAWIVMPFRNAGWKGGVLGFFAVFLLLYAMLIEGVGYARAKDVWVIPCAEVVAVKANVRQTPAIKDNVLAQRRRGEKICDAKISEELKDLPKGWVQFEAETGDKVYMHKSTLKLDYVNRGKDFGGASDHIFTWICVAIYLVSAFAAIMEKFRLRKEARRLLFGMDD